MPKLKHILFAVLFGLIFVNPALALAQNTNKIDVPKYEGVENSLTEFLCTPNPASNGQDLVQCINKGYRFGVAFGGIALVFFLVFAGYMYMTGGETGKTKAKGILQNALVGIALLLGSYVLLRFINPNLVIIRPIQTPVFTAADLPSCEAVGLGEACVLSDGGIGIGGGTCEMPIADSAVTSFNNTVHNPWDNNPETPDRHRTVRKPPNGPPVPEGAVDLKVSKQSPVYASMTGKVIYRSSSTALGGSGSYITLSSDVNGSDCSAASSCSNLAHIDPSVKVGDMVKAGQQVGVTTVYSGSFGPHLHLELKVGGQWITGDGKKGTWDNMKSAIAKCKSAAAASGSGSSDLSKAPAGMVEVTQASHGVKINLKYGTEDNFTGSVLYQNPKCYLTKNAADKLKKAQEALTKQKKQLEIYDCYRPTSVQDKMVEWAKGKVDWAKKQSKQPNDYVGKYISQGGNHPLGKAVDLTISGSTMPSAFDTFSSASSYKSSNASAKLLRDTMQSAGFSPLDSEWWHFSDSGGDAVAMSPKMPQSFAPADGADVYLVTSTPNATTISCTLGFDAEVEPIFNLLIKSAQAQRTHNCAKDFYTKIPNSWPNHYRQDDYKIQYGTCPAGKGGTIAESGCGVVATAMVLNRIKALGKGTNSSASSTYLAATPNAFTVERLAQSFVDNGYRVCGDGSSWDSPSKMIPWFYPNYTANYIQYGKGDGDLTYLKKSNAKLTEIMSNTNWTIDNGGWAIAVVGGGAPWTMKGHFVLVFAHHTQDNHLYYKIADPYKKTDVVLVEKELFASLVKGITYIYKE